jgi:hypothetical protein
MATSRNRDYSAPPDGIRNVSALYAWDQAAIITGSENPQTGAWSSLQMNPNGSLEVGASQSSTVSNSSPSGSFATNTLQTGIALQANNARKFWFIQNTSTSVQLFIRLSSSPASSGNFNIVLNHNVNAGHGGERFSNDNYLGAVSVSGGPFIAWELT